MQTRRSQALQVRSEAAALAFQLEHPAQINNGEEADYRSAANQLNYIANFSKGLHHNALGEVVPQDYRALLRASTASSHRTSRRFPAKGCRRGLKGSSCAWGSRSFCSVMVSPSTG